MVWSPRVWRIWETGSLFGSCWHCGQAPGTCRTGWAAGTPEVQCVSLSLRPPTRQTAAHQALGLSETQSTGRLSLSLFFPKKQPPLHPAAVQLSLHGHLLCTTLATLDQWAWHSLSPLEADSLQGRDRQAQRQ